MKYRAKTNGRLRKMLNKLEREYDIWVVDPCMSHMDGCDCNTPFEYEVTAKLTSPSFKSRKEAETFIKILEEKRPIF